MSSDLSRQEGPGGLSQNIVSMTIRQMEAVLAGASNEHLDGIIAVTERAEVLFRLARIERGRRTEKQSGGDRSKVLPGSTLLDQTEKNRRSEEMLVVEYDPTPEEIETFGWKKLVKRARDARKLNSSSPPSDEPHESPKDEPTREPEVSQKRSSKASETPRGSDDTSITQALKAADLELREAEGIYASTKGAYDVSYPDRMALIGGINDAKRSIEQALKAIR